jgi:hypothetical protein
MLIKRSLILSTISSIYFLEEISEKSKNIFQFIIAYTIQNIHDFVCIYFIFIYIYSFFDNKHHVQINTLYTLIMFLFSIYKRCILTLMYNYVLDLSMCTRYIPIWQRLINIIITNHNNTFCIEEDKYKSTYMWLNDHIFQSGMMITLNMFWMMKKSGWIKNLR